jgi:site-specific DNA recombinase
VSRLNPEADRKEAKAPHLRIIDDETWQQVQTRRAERSKGPNRFQGRPRRLLSGLLKCGCCGAGYSIAGRDKRGDYVRCSGHRDRGTCENRRSVSLAMIEQLVLEGIEKHLAAPELVAEWVREFHRAWQELTHTQGKRREVLSRDLARKKADQESVVDMLVQAKADERRPLLDRLGALELERKDIERELAGLCESPIRLHPNAADMYRHKVADLKAALASADAENRAAAFQAIRELVEAVLIHPTAPYRFVEIEIKGRIAALLQRPEEAAYPESKGALVAGVGFEPTTFRL